MRHCEIVPVTLTLTLHHPLCSFFQELATRRVHHLEVLLEFVQNATKQLMWLNEKEEYETSRDWSAKNLNVAELEAHKAVSCTLYSNLSMLLTQ